jgi:hypothetical protein
VIALLAAKASRLDCALRKIAWRGGEVGLLDGTLLGTRRRSARSQPWRWSICALVGGLSAQVEVGRLVRSAHDR